MEIILRNGDEVFIDPDKIVDVVATALDCFIEAVNEIMEEFDDISVLHSLAHLMLRYFSSLTETIKLALPFPPCRVIFIFPICSTCVKVLSSEAGYISHKNRIMYLMRSQDRSSDDSEGDSAFNYLTA